MPEGKVGDVVVGGAVVGSAMEVVVVVVLVVVVLVLVLEAVEWLLSVVEVAVHAATTSARLATIPGPTSFLDSFEGQGTGVFGCPVHRMEAFATAG